MSNIFNTYNQYPIDIVAGHDWHLTDKNGQTYLDFTSGIGVCNFGYSNEQITDNVFEQATKIWHTSNLYQSQLTEDVAGLVAGGLDLGQPVWLTVDDPTFALDDFQDHAGGLVVN